MSMASANASRGTLAERFDAFERRRAFMTQRVEFLNDLGEMLLSGKGSINQVLSASARRTPSLTLAAAYRDIRERVTGGLLLHVALAPYFRPVENMLIESVNVNAKTDAERGQGFVAAATMIHNLGGMRGGFLELIAAIVVSLLTVGAMGIGVAPFAAAQFEQISPRRFWPELARMVIDLGDTLAVYWPVSVLAAVGAITALLWALPNWTGERRRWADQKLPAFRLYRLARSTPLMMTLGTFLAARVGFDRALRAMLERANPWERMYLQEMAANFGGKQKRGVDIIDVGMFDWQAMVRVEVRSMGVDLDDALRYVAAHAGPKLVARVNNQLKGATATVRFLQRFALMLIAASVAFIYLSTVQNVGRSL